MCGIECQGMYANLNAFFNKVLKLSDEKVEHMYLIALDLKNRVIGIQHNSVGNKHTVEIDKRNMALFLDLLNADGFIMLHNHPKVKGYNKKDTLGFSDEDIVFTEEFLQYRKLNDITCMDSMIISHNDYVVYADRFKSQVSYAIS